MRLGQATGWGAGATARSQRWNQAAWQDCFCARLNGAVIEGFKKDVGSKISFYGFTVNTMKNSLITYSKLGFTSIPQGQVGPCWAASGVPSLGWVLGEWTQ